MRRALAGLTLAACAVVAASAASALTDSVLSVPVPDGWVLWTPEEIRAANPHPEPGLTIAGQAGAFPFGHRAFNPTLTLSRLELGSAEIRAPSARALAENLLAQMRNGMEGFRASPEAVAEATIAGFPAAHWSGRTVLRIGATPLDVTVCQAAILTGPQTAHLITLIAPGHSAWEAHFAEALLPQVTAVRERPAESSPASPVPGPSPRRRWSLSGPEVPLPRGWVVWDAGPVNAARDQGLIPPLTGSHGVIGPKRAAAPVPFIAIEVQDWGQSPFVPHAVALCRRSALQSLAQLGGDWVTQPLPIAVGGHPAARAAIEAPVRVGAETLQLRVEHLWIAADRRAVHLALTREASDAQTGAVFEQTAAALVP